MARIIIEPPTDQRDFPGKFLRAITLVHEGGVKLESGTKLVSRYAVLVVDDPLKAIQRLQAEGITAHIDG